MKAFPKSIWSGTTAKGCEVCGTPFVSMSVIMRGRFCQKRIPEDLSYLREARQTKP